MITWLTLLFAIEFGYTPNTAVYNRSWINTQHIETTYLTLELDFIIKDVLYIGGTSTTWQDYISTFDWGVYQSTYTYHTYIKYSNFSVGYRHWCAHPIIPAQLQYKPEHITEHSGDIFFIRYEGKL
jgi:hypothetical protein